MICKHVLGISIMVIAVGMVGGTAWSLAGQTVPAGHKLLPHLDSTPPAQPSQADRARGFQLFSRHWMEAVFDTTVPPRDAPLVGLNTFASPGEYEPVAFGLHALKDLKSVQLKATPLNYGILTDLNTRPRTTYLASVKNPNPEIVES